jgi:hypothetical protein
MLRSPYCCTVSLISSLSKTCLRLNLLLDRFHPASTHKMAPPKGARATAQELSFEDSSTITKQKLAVQAQISARGRRNGAAAATNGHSLKDLASASETVSQATGQTPTAPIGVCDALSFHNLRIVSLTPMSLSRSTGEKKTPPYYIAIAPLTPSRVPRPSTIPWPTAYYNPESACNPLQWHAQSKREECGEKSWP